MQSRANKALTAIASGAIWAGGALLSLVMLFSVGPSIEEKYFPVTTEVHATLVETRGDTMVFKAVGNKNRHCSLLDVRVLVENPDRLPTKGAIWVIDDGIGPRTRPLGFQDLGTWGVIPKGDKLTVTGIYRCHPLWVTRTPLGVWDTHETEKQASQ